LPHFDPKAIYILAFDEAECWFLFLLPSLNADILMRFVRLIQPHLAFPPILFSYPILVSFTHPCFLPSLLLYHPLFLHYPPVSTHSALLYHPEPSYLHPFLLILFYHPCILRLLYLRVLLYLIAFPELCLDCFCSILISRWYSSGHSIYLSLPPPLILIFPSLYFAYLLHLSSADKMAVVSLQIWTLTLSPTQT
jgi:hypothetical protein